MKLASAHSGFSPRAAAMLLVGSLALLACSDESSPSGSTASGGAAGAASSAGGAGGAGGTGGEAAGASGGGAPTGEIACGTGPCELPLEVCCTEMGIGACVAGACPAGQGQASCDGPEDCQAGACCVSGGFATECVEDATACGPEDIVCHSPRDCPTGRPLCCQQLDDNYRTCTANAAGPCN